MRKNILLTFVIIVCLMPSRVMALDIANFDTLQTYPFGSSAISIAAGDINGDGFPDLVAARIWTNEVGVSINDGTGHFAFTGTYGVGQAPYKVQLGDMNKDIW